ncbi:MAG: DUF1579 family protein [Planctomycetes bacterium]|nr:DUF1579 family protein [Planctomycetota bacterium]
MKHTILAGALAGSLFVPLALPDASGGAPQDPKKEAPAHGQGGGDMAAMMAKAAKFIQPGPQHKALERFLGRWNTETRVFMAGQATPPDKGTAEVTWQIEGRWLLSKAQGRMMGMPISSCAWIGYDNFKMSYVVTMVSSMDTAMTRSEGDMTQDGKSLITYGTLDEYLTGEHDKMVKYVWRFLSDDEIVLEVHDLPIGEVNTKVVEMRYVRAK